MSEKEQAENIYRLTDEDGNESSFEYLGELELDDNRYLALIPLEDDSEEDEYVILKITLDEDGEELLLTIDDDDEFASVADAFEDYFMQEYDLDGEPEEDSEEDENETEE